MNSRDLLERLVDALVTLLLPFYNIIHYFKQRKYRQEFRTKQIWEFMMYGYKSCAYYREGECGLGYCYREREEGFFYNRGVKLCKKSPKCKHYVRDPFHY